MPESKKKIVSTIAMGRWWMKMPYTILLCSCSGKPSSSEWILKLMNNPQGKCVCNPLAGEWKWPCSAPWEKNSKTICKSMPTTIHTPIALSPKSLFSSWVCNASWYTSGRRWKMVIPIKKAPLKANNNLILLFCVGLSHNTRQAPITIERKGRR